MTACMALNMTITQLATNWVLSIGGVYDSQP